MTPVHQRHENDCVRACVASIFDLPLDSVPVLLTAPSDGVNEAPWSRNLRAWLSQRGYAALFVDVPDSSALWPGESMPFHYIMIGRHPSGRHHAVVYFAGELVHDPSMGNLTPFLSDVFPQMYVIFVKA